MDTLFWLCSEHSYGISADDAKSLWQELDKHGNAFHTGPTPDKIEISFGYTENTTWQTTIA